MRFACWIIKVRDPHSEYKILTAFLLQQWLHERVSTLRHSYIACSAFGCAQQNWPATQSAAFKRRQKPRHSNSVLLHTLNDIPSSLLKDLPFLLPTFTRRTSGHCLGTFTETNISCSHSNDNNVLPLTGSPLFLFKRLVINVLN